MALFPRPADIITNYLQILKSIKPSIDVNDPNSDFVIRGKTFSGIASGLYGDQQKVRNDIWISTSRPEALTLHGEDDGIAQQPATQANSLDVEIQGPNGTVITPSQLTFLYVPTNVVYTNTNGGTISGGVLHLQVQCQVTGQIGNIKAPDFLTVTNPPSGVQTQATLIADMTNGSDIESTDSYRARLLSNRQSPPAGGNETDYPRFAFEADSSVRSAFIRRFGRGLGTVDVYITVGTTDIDNAITNGLPILRIPSPIVIANVQAYYNAHVPLTDCPAVFGPTELNVNVTVNVNLAQGLTLTSVPADPVNNPLNLNCRQLIQREISRALYKNPVGGRSIPGKIGGYVVAADIEANLDLWLSAVPDFNTGLPVGKIPILLDRQCQPLNGSQYDLLVGQAQLAAPGTLTVVLGVP